MWGLVRSLDSGKLGWSVLCGAAAAGAMLTKYWSLFLAAGDGDHRDTGPAAWLLFQVSRRLMSPPLFFLF